MTSFIVPTHPANAWRPKLHYSAKANWINDPNGLFYKDGIYHLYYQMNPDDSVWGNMHWGHAISRDLLHWEEMPIALDAEPDGLGYAFSGGAVVDWDNSSGLGDGVTPPIIATFTQHSKAAVQVQSIAYSLDGGQRFVPYAGNPVIPNPGLKDFRDPKVVWHAAQTAVQRCNILSVNSTARCSSRSIAIFAGWTLARISMPVSPGMACSPWVTNES